MITKNIALNIKTCLSGLSFSFDELILETKNLFEIEGIPGFLKAIISFIDNMVVERWKASNEAQCF
ncbi:hypothetical protein OAT67_02780 [Bacteriovoracaceae bacterium]|nr:hypothetical protein [Bacteriovoracaceae bacterium]